MLSELKETNPRALSLRKPVYRKKSNKLMVYKQTLSAITTDDSRNTRQRCYSLKEKLVSGFYDQHLSDCLA